MSDNLLLQDDLIDYADIPNDVDGYGRKPWIEGSLPDSASVAVESSGGYQGTMCFVVYCNDTIWLIDTYYGSCSHCDGHIANEYSSTERLLREARGFESKETVKEWLLREADDNLAFRGGYDEINNSTVLEMIDEVTPDE